jgi:hypothetical protein
MDSHRTSGTIEYGERNTTPGLGIPIHAIDVPITAKRALDFGLKSFFRDAFPVSKLIGNTIQILTQGLPRNAGLGSSLDPTWEHGGENRNCCND